MLNLLLNFQQLSNPRTKTDTNLSLTWARFQSNWITLTKNAQYLCLPHFDIQTCYFVAKKKVNIHHYLASFWFTNRSFCCKKKLNTSLCNFQIIMLFYIIWICKDKTRLTAAFFLFWHMRRMASFLGAARSAGSGCLTMEWVATDTCFGQSPASYQAPLTQPLRLPLPSPIQLNGTQICAPFFPEMYYLALLIFILRNIWHLFQVMNSLADKYWLKIISCKRSSRTALIITVIRLLNLYCAKSW